VVALGVDASDVAIAIQGLELNGLIDRKGDRVLLKGHLLPIVKEARMTAGKTR
jgi:hypothetical protein